MQAPITFGKGLLTDNLLLLAESSPLNPMTLETLEAMYAAGLRDMPRMAVYRRVGGGKRCGSIGGSIGGRDSSDSPTPSTLHTVHIGLLERLVGGGIREVVGAIGGAVIDEDTAALHAPFVLIKELAFRVKKLGALFARGRGRCSG
jgi:hypothetical protein